ncbi:type II secretion system F family protein [Cryobacterium zhongshanensis]|uniref:Type II secretion system F family protein n=1 Tax=Cryobacterium zhongshanensis TaxID=2928153 RepID=A0AA41UHD0_9MICO|nr:type II secretion system F family protein [Cryobacterium zhongshanensis]MCI4659780.1 type II secretion system F family protein [Cryobacterium zhongshanensis]
MSNTFTLADDTAEAGGVNTDTSPDTGAAAPVTGWQPSANATFLVGAPGAISTPANKKPAARKAAKAVKPAKKSKAKAPVDEQGIAAPVKMLPEPKPPKKLSKKEQRKADKALLLKERTADAAAMRINGTDDDNIVIPKKPFLTVFNGKRARPDEVAETLTDLASMLENGQSERKSVEALAEQYSNYDIGEAYERVVMLLDRGVTLGAAMADQEDAFPPVVRELIGAAKMPKDMHRNLRQAAIIIVEADNIKSQIKNALFKPGFMAFFLLLFTLASIQWLLPMTTGMFTGIGAAIPPTTVIIISVGSWLKWGLLAVIIFIVVWKLFWAIIGKNNERMATISDTWALEMPLIGEITRMSVAARFCDVLAACLNVGMSEIEALETAGRACGNRALKAWVDEHVGRQRVGLVAFGDVAQTEMLPWNFRNRIETTSSLTRRIEILFELAETFHTKAQQRLTRFADRVGPLTEGAVVIVVILLVMLIISPILTFIPTMIATIG